MIFSLVLVNAEKQLAEAEAERERERNRREKGVGKIDREKTVKVYTQKNKCL